MYNLAVTIETEPWLVFSILVLVLERYRKRCNRHAVAYAVEAYGYLMLFKLKTMWEGI